ISRFREALSARESTTITVSAGRQAGLLEEAGIHAIGVAGRRGTKTALQISSGFDLLLERPDQPHLAMAVTTANRNSHHLAAIVSSSDDAIVSKDLNGIVTSWNGAAERMFGYTAKEPIGKSIRLIIPPDRQSEEDEVLRRIRAGNSVKHFDTVRVRKDGSPIPISLTISPIFDAERNVVGASKIARDISERRTREARLAAIEAARADLHARLLMLVNASTTLFGTPHLSAVVGSALKVAADPVPADAYVIGRLKHEIGWQPVGFDGVSPAFARITSAHGKTELDFTEPITVEDV